MNIRKIIIDNDTYVKHNEKMKGINDNSSKVYLKKINDIFGTVRCLEESLIISRNLEAEQWLRHSILKMKNKVIVDDLKKANKRGKNMLNLFRQSVTDIRLGIEIPLPESLKREVQRTWHEKYDGLLMENERLKNEVTLANLKLQEKDKQIDDLQQKLLDLAENLTEREENLKKLVAKYLNLKERKKEQENRLHGCIETLRDKLEKTNGEVTKKNIGTNVIPSKDALLTREIRRCDRLAYENSVLRVLLQEARQECKSMKYS